MNGVNGWRIGLRVAVRVRRGDRGFRTPRRVGVCRVEHPNGRIGHTESVNGFLAHRVSVRRLFAESDAFMPEGSGDGSSQMREAI